MKEIAAALKARADWLDLPDYVEAPRPAETWCSQCGKGFGPGDSGFSHCHQHTLNEERDMHTPGPWEWVDSPAWGYSALWNPETRQEVLVPGGRNEADSPEVWMGEEMSDADKALIAAAPEMAKALEEIARRLTDFQEDTGTPDSDTALQVARAVLAKRP